MQHKWESLLDAHAEKLWLIYKHTDCHPNSFLFAPGLRIGFCLHEARNTDQKFSDINALILDYLTMEGYSNAAAKFSKEANLQPHQDTTSIRARQRIQHFILCGDIQAAIKALNELDPEVSKRILYCFLLCAGYDMIRK